MTIVQILWIYMINNIPLLPIMYLYLYAYSYIAQHMKWILQATMNVYIAKYDIPQLFNRLYDDKYASYALRPPII